MFIQTEVTPNPQSLKFNSEKKLLDKGSLEFKTKEEAESLNLAKKLFELDSVVNVFISESFVTITKKPEVDWEVIKPSILAKIMECLSSGKVIKNKIKNNNKKLKKKYTKKNENIVKQIEDLLDKRIKPAVAQDGGDIKFVKYEKGIVFLEMRGACAGCPSSTMTLKAGIENMLKYYVPEIVSVEAIN